MTVENALLIAAKEGDLNKLLSAVEDGADINAQDSKGYNVLDIIGFHDEFSLMNEFLTYADDLNININQKDANGYTTLMKLCSYSRPKMIKLIIQHQDELAIKINEQTKTGQTAFMFACWQSVPEEHSLKNSSIETVKTLIENSEKLGLDANIKTTHGFNVLFGVKSVEIMKLLIDYRSLLNLDFNCSTNEGVSLFEYLYTKDDTQDIVKLLIENKQEIGLILTEDEINKFVTYLRNKHTEEARTLLHVAKEYLKFERSYK